MHKVGLVWDVLKTAYVPVITFLVWLWILWQVEKGRR